MKQKNLSDTLFDAFANEDYSSRSAQEWVVLWAIIEGFDRAKLLGRSFKLVRANKKHECARNCEIHPGDQYFSSMVPGGVILCVRCMAMILYYMDVKDYPVYRYDYWDVQKNEPHLAEDGEFTSAMKSINNSITSAGHQE